MHISLIILMLRNVNHCLACSSCFHSSNLGLRASSWNPASCRFTFPESNSCASCTSYLGRSRLWLVGLVVLSLTVGGRCGCFFSETLQLLLLLLLNLNGAHDIPVLVISFLAMDFRSTTAHSSKYILAIIFLLLGTLLGFQLIQISSLSLTPPCAAIHCLFIHLREEHRN